MKSVNLSFGVALPRASLTDPLSEYSQIALQLRTVIWRNLKSLRQSHQATGVRVLVLQELRRQLRFL